MNKKIHELMVQATSVTFKYNPMSGELDGRAEHFDKEKFAELIVRECADLFEVEWGDEKLTGNDVGYVVKKHFGVEE